MKSRNGWAFALLLVLPGAGANAAPVYKWTDDQGHTVYSERPPPGGAVEKIEPRGGTASADAIAKLKERSAPPPAREAAPAVETAEQKAQRETACAQARKVIDQLTHSTRMQYINEKQERAFLTEDQRQARLKEAHEALAKYCQ